MSRITLVVNPVSQIIGGYFEGATAISDPANPNVAGISIQMRGRPVGDVTWLDVGAPQIVSLDGQGNANASFIMPVPVGTPLGFYEFMAHASLGTAFEDSNIVTVQVVEVLPPPPPPPGPPLLLLLIMAGIAAAIVLH